MNQPSDLEPAELAAELEQRHPKHSRVTVGLAALAALTFGAMGFVLGSRDSGVDLSADASESATTSSSTVTTASVVADDGVQRLPVLARRTSDGIDLRVSIVRPASQTGAPPPISSFPTPGHCTRFGLRMSFSLPAGADQITLPITATGYPRSVATSAISATGEHLMVVVLTDTNSSHARGPFPGGGEPHARATFPGGGDDWAKAASGITVLASKVPAAKATDFADLEVSLSTGGEIADLPLSVAIPQTGHLTEVPPQQDCSESLPAPGVQPDHVGAAKAAVLETFETVYDLDTPATRRDALITDPTGIETTFQRLLSSYPEGSAAGATWTSTGLVFTSPTTAVVGYDIDIPVVKEVGTLGHGRLGTAHLVDGKWKVTRETLCSDLALTGAICPPGAG